MTQGDIFDKLVASHIRETPATGALYLRSFLSGHHRSLFLRVWDLLVEVRGQQGEISPASGARLFHILTQVPRDKEARAEATAILKPLHINTWEIAVGSGTNKSHHRHGRRRVQEGPR